MNAPPCPRISPWDRMCSAPSPRYRELIEQAVSADPFHVGRVDPEFFATAGPGEQCWALEDEKGYVIFFLKTQVACRLHIQFGPAATAVEKARNRDAMILGVEWMEGVLQASGYREMIFDTANPFWPPPPPAAWALSAAWRTTGVRFPTHRHPRRPKTFCAGSKNQQRR